MILSNLRRRFYRKAYEAALKAEPEELRAFVSQNLQNFYSNPEFKKIARTVLNRLPEKLNVKEKIGVLKILIYCCNLPEQEKYLKHFSIKPTIRFLRPFFDWLSDQYLHQRTSHKSCNSILDGFKGYRLPLIGLDNITKFIRRNYFLDELMKRNVKLPFSCDVRAVLCLNHKYFKKIFNKKSRLLDQMLNERSADHLVYLSRSGKLNANHNFKLIQKMHQKELNTLFYKYPVLEILLKELNESSFSTYKHVARQSYLNYPKVTEFLNVYFGIKSSTVVNLFLKSKNKSVLMSVGRIGKSVFVDKGKPDFSVRLLSMNLSLAERRYKYTLQEIAQHYTHCLNHFFTPEQSFTLLQKLIKSKQPNLPLEVMKRLEKLQILDVPLGVKFSEINTWEKLDFFATRLLNRVTKMEQPLREELNCPPLFKLTNARIENLGLVIKVPQTNYDLFDWGMYLHNCVGDYVEKCINAESFIIGVFENDHIKYCLEINIEGQIKQIEGKYKTFPPKAEVKKIQLTIKKSFS